MKKILMICFVCLVLSGIKAYSISNDDIRALMDKKNATVIDALYMVYSIDKPDAVISDLASINNPRISALKKDANLDAGAFAIIAIEMKKARGSILYSLTGFSKYAAECLVFDKIYPEYYSWNRELSGQELIEFTALLKSK